MEIKVVLNGTFTYFIVSAMLDRAILIVYDLVILMIYKNRPGGWIAYTKL